MSQVYSPNTQITGVSPKSLAFPVAVVGLGYVGLPLALLAARKGHAVVGIDISAEKVKTINSGRSPFYDEAINGHLATTKLRAETEFTCIRDVEVVVICVPTPVKENHVPDLNPLVSACESIAPYLRHDALVIVESTINPGVCDNHVIPTLESASGKKAGVDFQVSHCPERVNPGDPLWNVENIHRVVGSLTDEGLERTLTFYRSILLGEVRAMQSLKEAEAVKIVENTFRDINIAFVNELARSFDTLGIDVTNVIEAAATKPFAFMAHFPSCGVGGHCIPVDPYYLIEEGRRNGFEHEFLALARRINNSMPAYTVDVLEKALEEHGKRLEGARIAVLGLAYKADIDDTRESPAYEIIAELEERGASVSVYDPYVSSKKYEPSLASALEGADAAILATAHREFRTLMPTVFLEKNVQIVVDGKNCLCKKTFRGSGITYRGIGR